MLMLVHVYSSGESGNIMMEPIDNLTQQAVDTKEKQYFKLQVNLTLI